MPMPPITYCKKRTLEKEIKVVVPLHPKYKKYHIFQQLENDKQRHALENWKWFEEDRPTLQESLSKRINRPQEKLMMDQGSCHRLKMENNGIVDSLKRMEDMVRGEAVRGRAIQLERESMPEICDAGEDSFDEFHDTDEEEERRCLDNFKPFVNVSMPEGPAAELSRQDLLFCSKPGEIDQRTVTVYNKGTTAIFYSWERRPVEPLVLPGRRKEGWRLFTVMRGTGSLLPGYARKFTFKYFSREVGTHLETWLCRIYPKLDKPVQMVDLKGVTMHDDRLRARQASQTLADVSLSWQSGKITPDPQWIASKWRTALTAALEYREMMTGIREALADVLVSAGKTSQPPDELRKQDYLYTKAAFDFIRYNLAVSPPVFFGPKLFAQLENLHQAVSTAVPKAPDPPQGEVVCVEEMDRSPSKSKKKKETKGKKDGRGTTAEEQAGDNLQGSKRSKRRKSKGEEATSSQAEAGAEDSGKKKKGKKRSKEKAQGEAEGEAEASDDKKEPRMKTQRRDSKRKPHDATTSQAVDESRGGVAASPPQADGTSPDASSSPVEVSSAAWAGSVSSILEAINTIPERAIRRQYKKQLAALLETAAVPNHQTSLLLTVMYKSLHQISGDVETVLETVTEESGRPIVEKLLQTYYAQIEAEQTAAEPILGSGEGEDPEDLTWPFKDDDSDTDWLPEEEKKRVKTERENEMLAFVMRWIHILTEARCILRYGFDKAQDRISDEQASVAATIDLKIAEYSQKSTEDACWKVFDLERKKQHLQEELDELPVCQLPNCPNCPRPEEPKAKDPNDESDLSLPRRGLSILD